MNDSDKIRSVVARFFNVAEAEVTDSFIFPSERMQSSVARTTLHAAIKRLAGTDLPSAFTANTYAQLLKAPAESSKGNGAPAARPETVPLPPTTNIGTAIGIDIEHDDNLPASTDPWSEAFYTENFTRAEIAYCQRQREPKLSFCGIWSAKEAAVKTGLFPGARLFDLEIFHDEAGRPKLRNNGRDHIARECVVSISHSRSTAVAVCVYAQPPKAPERPTPTAQPVYEPESRTQAAKSQRFLWFTLGLSAAAIVLWLWMMWNR
jgi:phosphopantetheine--protein transferase-like protein